MNTPPLVFTTFSIKDALTDARTILAGISDSPALDAELLLAHCLEKNQTYLHTWPEKELDKGQLSAFQSLVEKRLTDYPVAYLLGRKAFWTLDLLVTPDVLIPRPETELLVEVALDKINGIENPQIIDLGTGSGAIALAIASERPDAIITASDYSKLALEIAKKNMIENNLEGRVSFVQSDWFSNIKPNQYDLIVSNPPYISPDDPHLKQSIRYEPIEALTAAKAGIKDIETIIQNSPSFLKKKGWLIIEHGYDQSEQTLKLLTNRGYSQYQSLMDLNNVLRLSLAQKIS